MTEQEWMSWNDPRVLLELLRRHGRAPITTAFSKRQLRLYSASCCLRVIKLCRDERTITALSAIEVSIGARTNQERQALKQARLLVWEDRIWRSTPEGRLAKALVGKDDIIAALESSWWAAYLRGGTSVRTEQERIAQGALLRDIIGNPFHPVPFDPRWRSESAVALASAIYAERTFDRMPILADALEEAGCDHPDVLHHCRDPQQPHARGCWVVDLVLNKS